MPVLSARWRAHLAGEVIKLRIWGGSASRGDTPTVIDPKADLLSPGRERAPTSWVEPITTPAMPTSPAMTSFPCVIASAMNRRGRSTLGSSTDRVSRSTRIISSAAREVGQSKRRRPTAFANGESLGPRSRQSRPWRISRFSPARVPRLRPQKRGDGAQPAFSTYNGGGVSRRPRRAGRSFARSAVGKKKLLRGIVSPSLLRETPT